jgi:hypothetical protein
LTCKTCQAQLQPEWLDCPYCLTPRFQDWSLLDVESCRGIGKTSH